MLVVCRSTNKIYIVTPYTEKYVTITEFNNEGAYEIISKKDLEFNFYEVEVEVS